MSVQAGIWNFDAEPASRELLAKISLAVAEFAPDAEELFYDGPFGMLYRPLHVTLESRLESQPYLSAGGRLITWDGRLDNRDELISQLRDNLASDRSDVAVVAAAFDRWGRGGFAKIIGDWALAIWNPKEKELLLARDYIGVKHLFYCPKATGVIWCSHLAPLVLYGGRFTVSDEYVAGYFGFHPDSHLTPYREILSVPPGKFVRICSARATTDTYWRFDIGRKTRFRTDAEYEEHFRFLFRQAVRRRLRTDSPVLMELSGGWDSSSLVCMADEILAREGAEKPRVDTFSYYDSKEPGEDDLEHLIRIEEKRGRKGFHTDLAGAGDSLSLDCSTFAAVPGFMTRSEVKEAIARVVQVREYRVVISGMGGDEMNAQALNPRVHLAEQLLRGRLFEAAKDLVSWSLLLRRPLIQLLLETLIQFLPLPARARLTEQGRLEPWINRRFARRQRLSARQMEHIRHFWVLSPAVRDAAQTIATLAGALTYIPPSLLEHRYPYLDQTLVEFLTTIPLEQLLRPGHRRFLMRRSLVHLLPPQILARKTKTSAGRCYPVALERHWEAVESSLVSPFISRLGYVDRDKVRAALIAMKNGQIPIHFLRLFKALSLELWLRDVHARGMISFQDLDSGLNAKELACA